MHLRLIPILLLMPALVAAAPLPRFPSNAIWNQDISNAPLAANSAGMISTLAGLGGWGNGNVMQIDFSMFVLHADQSAPMAPVIAGSGGYYLPDCDTPGVMIPLPAGGAIEGSSSNNYTCDNNNNDCHLLVVQGNTLFEAWTANVTGGAIQSTCAVRWDLSKVYPRNGRGEQCTSADAAGFPIAPLLFNADEVAAAVANNGDIGHAIRFILPNNRMAKKVYVHPASHTTSATSGPAGSVPYGVRMRLKASFDMSRYSPAAKVLLRTMQRYGIVLADGGEIALTGESDRFTSAKWPALGIDSKVFVRGNPSPKVTDFEVVEAGPQYALGDTCVRNASDFIFTDGYDY